MEVKYSTKKITPELIAEITEALKGISYGSLEVYVQNNTVTQITIRNIKKTIKVNKGKTNGNGKKLEITRSSLRSVKL